VPPICHDYSNRVRVLPPFFRLWLIEGWAGEQTPSSGSASPGSPTRIGYPRYCSASAIQPVLDRIPNAVFRFAASFPRESGQVR